MSEAWPLWPGKRLRMDDGRVVYFQRHAGAYTALVRHAVRQAPSRLGELYGYYPVQDEEVVSVASLKGAHQ